MRPSRVRSLSSLAALLLALSPCAAMAATVDFNTFTVESYPVGLANADAPNWVILNGGRAAAETLNSTATVLYSPDSILNKHIRGVIVPGSDDDYVGLALGFNPGNATSPGADYLLLDWKRANQGAFNYTGNIHDLTPGGVNAPLGLALSRVEGVPTNDEFWQHANLPQNPGGSVTELARGLTRGNSGYSTIAGHLFDIIYEADRVQVFVDNVLQMDVAGNFGGSG